MSFAISMMIEGKIRFLFPINYIYTLSWELELLLFFASLDL